MSLFRELRYKWVRNKGYVLQGQHTVDTDVLADGERRVWEGPNDPTSQGFTVRDGDVWEHR